MDLRWSLPENECFLMDMPNRSTNTLLKAIEENFEKETIIYFDSWKSYCTSKLEEESFEHFKVNHKCNFIDLKTGKHTQKIEKLWVSVKWRNKKHRGTARHHLESYLE